MENENACPKCGNKMTFEAGKEIWHCDECQYAMDSMNPTDANSLPPREQSTVAIWLLVIVVLSVVIMTFIAAAALYLMVGDIINENPGQFSGELEFVESSTESGLYTGGFSSLSDSIALEYISLTVIDHSLGYHATLEPLIDGGTIVVPDGLRCSFSDVNHNGILDTEDIIRIEGGAPEDILKFIHIPTGRIITQYTLT